MRRLATTTAFALALSVLPFSPASAGTAPSSRPVPNSPTTAQWVFIGDFTNEQFICIYVGNQLVESGQYQAYECRVGPPGEFAMWAETY